MKRLIPKWSSLIHWSKRYVSKKLPFLLSPPLPRRIQIECTTRCNLKCTMCGHSFNPSSIFGDLSFENFRYIVDSFPQLRSVDMTPLGEVFMNRDFLRMLKYLKSKSIYVDFTDNFTLLTPKIAEQLILMQIDEIFTSFDGATKETFESIRVGANFEKVIGNIRSLIRLKNEKNSKLPQLVGCFVVSNQNIDEVPLMVDLAKSLNWLRLEFINVRTSKETKKLSIDMNDPKTKIIFKQALEKARKMNVRVSFHHFTRQPVEKCEAPWKSCYITYDGFVHPCCYLIPFGNREKQNEQSLGNIFKDDITKIWNSEKMKRFRMDIHKGKVPAVCSEYCAQ